MATLALKLVTLALLGLSVAWWLVDPGFEPLIAGVAAVAGLVSAGVVSAARQGRDEARDDGSAVALEAERVAPKVDRDAPPLSFTAIPHTVGRQAVVEVLEGQLDECRKGGRGRMVCVTGEAGIGKTTVAENFLAGLDAGTVTVARGRCSERLAGAGAYLPVLEALESLLRGPAGEEHAELMARTAPSWYGQLGPAPEATGSDVDGRVSQDRLKRDLTRFCGHLTRERPFVLFLEDLHWADVSTVDLLTYLADRFDGTATLVLATYRPEDMRLGKHRFLDVRPTLEQRGLLTEIPLEFLQPDDIHRYLAMVYPGHAFPVGFARAVHARTEGSPLFVVTLLGDLERQRVIAREELAWTLARSVEETERELPVSLAAMIERKTARLDEADRELLGVAAVQGYEFDAAVVAQSLDLDALVVEERLARLERDHRLVQRAEDADLPDGTPTARYEFVHVLYQHGLLDAMGPATKVAWSRRVAEALVEHGAGEDAGAAAELARLFEAGRGFERAARHYRVATAQALRLSAATEAVALARSGLDALDSVPESPGRDALELALLIVLGNALAMTEGWGGATEVVHTYERARLLAASSGRTSAVHPLLIQGLWYHFTQRNVAELQDLHEAQRAMADETGEPVIVAYARWVDAALEFWRGNVGAAHPLFEEAMAAYPPGHDGSRFVYGQDAWIGTASYDSWTLCLAGFPDRAHDLAARCTREADRLAHPFSVAYGLLNTTWVSILRHETHDALDQANRLLALAEEHALPFHGAVAGMQRAWALAEAGEPREGLSEMSTHLARHEEIGSVIVTTFFLALLADIHRSRGSPQDGLDVVDRALATEEEIEEWTFDAELRRLRGELLRLGGGDASEVEACYRSALEVAERQQSRWFGLRAAVSLGRMLLDQGRRDEAGDALRPVYDWFTEGFDTVDLCEAEELLRDIEA